MGWRRRTDGVFEGTAGDAMAVRVEVDFDATDLLDFSGHTWLAQVRDTPSSDEVVASFVTVDDQSGPDRIDVTVLCEDTSGITVGGKFFFGFMATDGAHAPYTVYEAIPVEARPGTARPA
jgi:hypothetical protein